MKRLGSTAHKLMLVAVLAVACAAPTFILQEYDGAPRAPESVAILRFEGTGTTDLVTLDGSVADAHVPDDARLHVEMLPGRHVIGVANRSLPNEPPRRVVFIAEAGRFYQVVLVAPGPNEWSPTPRVFEIDGRSGKPVRDVTEQRVKTEHRPKSSPAEVLPPPAASARPASTVAPPPEPAASEPSGNAGAAGE